MGTEFQKTGVAPGATTDSLSRLQMQIHGQNDCQVPQVTPVALQKQVTQVTFTDTTGVKQTGVIGDTGDIYDTDAVGGTGGVAEEVVELCG